MSAPNYQLQKKRSGHYVMYSVHYTTLQTKNTMRNASAINPVTMKNMDFCYKRRHHLYCESTPCTVSNNKWDTKEDESPESTINRVHYQHIVKLYVEATSNNKSHSICLCCYACLKASGRWSEHFY